MRISRKILLLICLLSGVFSSSVFAVLNIEITQGVVGAVPVAIAPFAWQSSVTDSAPLDVAAIVRADLARTGQFKSLPPQDMLARPHVDSKINFGNWRILQSEYLLVGTLLTVGKDRYNIRFRLYDVFKGKQMEGFNLSASGNNLRRAAHQVSDIVYQQLTGKRGAFTTSVAYVTAQGVGNDRQFSLWVSDADGENPQAMMRSNEPILSPAWSPNGKLIAYSSLEDQGHQVIFIQGVASGQREKVSFSAGLNGAPSWSPDGNSLALSLSKDGNAEIYVIDLASKKLRRLTNHWGIDTEPAWMPDGKSLVFTSDRGGKPQIYRVELGGKRPQRLTFEGKYNTRAAVSPDGESIAMIHLADGKFRVAVQDLETGNLRVLTKGVLDESPSFAPNGSMIIYATEFDGKGVLAAVSVDGRVHQRLSIQEADVREPAWSPFSN